MNILFVCTGNTCRSPLAHGMMHQLAVNHGLPLSIRSAGVSAYTGGDISANSALILREKGFMVPMSSQFLEEEALRWSDLVLTMTAAHKYGVMDRYPHFADKIFTLKEYAADADDDQDISDPYGGSLDVYRRTASEIERQLLLLLDKLKQQ